MKKSLFAFLSLLFLCISCAEKIIYVDSVVVDRSEISLLVGETAEIVATVSPADADDQNLIWISRNTDVAMVADGVVTAKSPGIAKIIVKSVDGNRTATCDVTVNDVSIMLNTDLLTITKGHEDVLTAEISPVNTLYTEVQWLSGNENVAIVEPDGKVTAIDYGHTFVYARVADVEVKSAVVVVADENVAIDYIDEYGVNHGKGIAVGKYVWAPVNCGYKAVTKENDGEVTDKGYPYGKLYQWGRRYGQGLGNDYDEYVLMLEAGPVADEIGQDIANQDVFYVVPLDCDDWNLTGMKYPWRNTQNDPCPEGWRVPSSIELADLFLNYSMWQENVNGIAGYYFSGCYSFYDYVPKVFLPASGYRSGAYALLRETGKYGYYWTSDVAPEESDPFFRSFKQGTVFKADYAYNRSFGYSIRCIQE